MKKDNLNNDSSCCSHTSCNKSPEHKIYIASYNDVDSESCFVEPDDYISFNNEEEFSSDDIASPVIKCKKNKYFYLEQGIYKITYNVVWVEGSISDDNNIQPIYYGKKSLCNVQLQPVNNMQQQPINNNEPFTILQESLFISKNGRSGTKGQFKNSIITVSMIASNTNKQTHTLIGGTFIVSVKEGESIGIKRGNQCASRKFINRNLIIERIANLSC
jgi:hypothetical protein